MGEAKTCSLCHSGFLHRDVVCHSPIFGDRDGVFHQLCMRRIDAVIELEGTNDISHIVYRGRKP